MTNVEYIKLLDRARGTYSSLTRTAMKKLEETYLDAAKLAARAMRVAKKAGRANITIESWNQLYIQLRNGAEMIKEAIENEVPLTVTKSLARFGRINTKYIMDAVKEAGSDKITRIGVNNMFLAINERVVRSIVNRVYQSGYSFSQSCWKAGAYYQEQIKRLVSTGLAQGRDVISVAKDIQIYTKKGRDGIIRRYAQRYGENLLPGTKEHLYRLANKVDYRALRLVRSELYASLQDAGRESGHINPACIDEYDWVRTTSQHYNCDCPEHEENSPYKYAEVPSYPHANCLCYVRPVLRDHEMFVDDLTSWTNGTQVPYIDNWYNNIYSYYA